jgi:hypothetical protein
MILSIHLDGEPCFVSHHDIVFIFLNLEYQLEADGLLSSR